MRRSWFGLGSLGLVAACGTDAVGVADCRELETARCEAAAACGYPAVSECRRYVRDHCLHGLPLEETPSGSVAACANLLEAAGACAASLGAEVAPGSCSPPLATDGSARTICDVILRPESAAACAFLTAEPAPAPNTPADAGNR